MDRLELHRPLLKWRRAELRRWLSERRLKWREDSTNAEPMAVRNRIRNEVIPLLDQVTGRDAVSSLLRMQDDFSELHAFAESIRQETNVVDPQDRLHLPQLRTLAPLLRKMEIVRYLERQGISLSRELVDRAMELADGASFSSINLPGGKRLRRRAARLFVE